MSSCADGEFWEGFTRGCFPGTQQRSHCGSTCAFPTPLERQHHRRRGCRGRCATWELLQVQILNRSSLFFPRKQPQGKSAWSCAAAWTNQVRKVLQHLGIGSILNEQCLHDAWKLPQTGIFSKCCCFFSRLALLKSEVAVIAIFPLCH